MIGYPDLEGFAYSFHRAELALGPRIFIAITNVSFDQPTTEGGVKGTRPWPLARTAGSMDIGEGTVTFSDEAERMRFLGTLGDAFREKIWGLSWTLASPRRPLVKLAAYSCRVLGNPFDHAEGEDALGGDINFSFLNHTVNGRAPHSGFPTVSF